MGIVQKSIDKLAGLVTRGRKIRIKQGLAKDFKPDSLDVGEFGLITDTNEVRIGIANGTSIKVNDGSDVSIPDASTTQKGIVQLVDNLTSEDNTKALSARMGNVLNQKVIVLEDKIDDVQSELTAHLDESEQHFKNQSIHVTQTEKNQWHEAFTDTSMQFAGRLGSSCSSITDWNDAKKNGWFMGAGKLNQPPGFPANTWFMGEVMVHNVSYVVQRVVQFTDPSRPTFERSCIGGTWGPWEDVTYSKLFTSVSSGKAKIAGATTDMGVPTAPDATYDQMAANIRAIQTKEVFPGTGVITSNGSQTIFAVSGLSFKPRAVIFRAKTGNVIGSTGMYNGEWDANIFTTVFGNNNQANIFSVFHGGFDVKVVYPNGNGTFDYWAIK